jgi:hypothetical protein
LELNRYRAPKRHPGIGFISGVHFRSTGEVRIRPWSSSKPAYF